jgi:hypothetical protein
MFMLGQRDQRTISSATAPSDLHRDFTQATEGMSAVLPMHSLFEPGFNLNTLEDE